MKDDKNVVFALNSFITNAVQTFSVSKNEPMPEFIEQGYLLFEDEAKADIFLNLCEENNKVRKTTNYTKYGYVQVDDFVSSRVDSQKHFYVGTVNKVENLAQDMEQSNESTVELTTENEDQKINKPKM